MTNTDRLERQAVASASKYMGVVAWPTVILGLMLATSYVAVVTLALAGILSLWVAVPVAAVVTFWSYTVLHESVHGSIGGNDRSLRALNRAMGYIAAWITMIPFTAHRYEHMAHHRHTNDAERDPDFHMGRMWDSPFAPVCAALRAWVSQFVYYAKYRWDEAPPRRNLTLCLEVAAAVAPRLAVFVAGYWVEGLALFVFAWILGAIVLVYLFAYVVHRPHTETGRYADTATILPPGPAVLKTGLNWAWMFQNYHSIHHLFPRVPFYKYAELYEEIEHVMNSRQAPIYSISLRGMKPMTPKLAARTRP
jgi:beta-carotene hydroxylase